MVYLNPKNDFTDAIDWCIQIGNANLQQKETQLAKLCNFQWDYLLLSDLITEYLQEDGKKFLPLVLLRYVAQLLIHEWNGVMMDFMYGNYSAAARTVRWALETGLGASIAILDGAILDSSLKSNQPMSFNDFKKWIERYDRNEVKLPRSKILKKLNISDLRIVGIEKTYKDLCKYVHLSNTFFRPIEDPAFHTRFSVNPILFDKIFKLTLATMDITMYSWFFALTQYAGVDDPLKKFMRGFRRDYMGFSLSLSNQRDSGFLLTKDMPITYRLISRLSK